MRKLSAVQLKNRILRNEIISPLPDNWNIKSFADKTHSLPPVTSPHFRGKSPKSDYVSDFETLSLIVRSKALGLELSVAKSFDEFGVTYSAQEILQAIKFVKQDLDKPEPINEKYGQISLKMVGVKIEGDLDLSKLDIPFSLRFIGCHFTDAIILDRSTTITLDISGSVINKGISTHFLDVSGSFRARRTVFLGPVDIGGIVVRGTTDFTDAILVPQNNPSELTAYVGDRGVLNLAKARLFMDLRLERARIYGGVNLRGCTIGGMLYMNDAVLRSAQAHYETIVVSMACEIWPADCRAQLTVPASASMNPDKDLAETLHPSPSRLLAESGVRGPLTIDDRRTIETLGTVNASVNILKQFPNSLQLQLLQETQKASEAALRADGATFKGPIFARSARICGRVRFKSATIEGGVSLTGARIRTARSVQRDLMTLIDKFDPWLKGSDDGTYKPTIQELNYDKIKDYVQRLVEQYQKEANNFKDSNDGNESRFAVDFFDATIDGSLDFGPDKRNLLIGNSGDKNLLGIISKHLCETGENPVRFLEIFVQDEKTRKEFEENSEWEEIHEGFDKKNFDYLNLVRATLGDVEAVKKNIDEYEVELIDLHKQLNSVYPQVPQSNLIVKLRKQIADLEDKIEIEHCDLQRCNRKLLNKLSDYPHKLSDRKPDWLLDPANVEKVQEALQAVIQDVGRLRSTLVLGEIQLSNAVIKGSLVFNRMIANIFEDHSLFESEQSRELISVQNITIEGDLDFRNSIGLSSVKADGATISGSVKFCDPVRYNSDLRRYNPIPSRAIFTAQTENEHVVDFERATIGGGLDLLFDAERGPNIRAKFANIGGKLQILPARFGVEMHPDDLDDLYSDSFKHIHTRHTQRTKSLPKLKWVAQGLNFLWGGEQQSKEEQIALNAFEKVKKPSFTIDLRSLSTPTFAHPPTAWPKQDGLIVDGMKYERTKENGPLYPAWKSWPSVWEDLNLNKVGIWKLVFAIPTMVLSFLLAIHTLVLIMTKIPNEIESQPLDTNSGGDSGGVESILNLISHWNPLSLAVTALVISGYLHWAFLVKKQPAIQWMRSPFTIIFVSLIFLCAFITSLGVVPSSVPVIGAENLRTHANNMGPLNVAALAFCSMMFLSQRITSIQTRPKFVHKYSYAVRWLLLQRRHFVTGRIFADTRPSEPYIRAAAVLRAAGRQSSADEVEIERMRLRTHSLSWRRAAPLRIILRILDLFIKYGFAPGRACVIVIFYIFISAGVFNYAKEKGVLVPTNPPCENIQHCQSEIPHFHSTYYAIDVFFPVLSIGEDKKWQTLDPDSVTPLEIQERLYLLIKFVRLVRWLMITLLLASLVTRVEALLARTGLV